MSLTEKRPRFLDLRKIKLPLPGIISILHRVSGICMVIAIPVGIYLFDLSLRSNESYHIAQDYSDALLFKLAATLILWSLCHHLFAGIRFLLLDLDVGVERSQARISSILILIVSIVTTLPFLGVIW
jgi:succinate dehydrogenase / fumarate reductase cytochrome b subunit